MTQIEEIKKNAYNLVTKMKKHIIYFTFISWNQPYYMKVKGKECCTL